MPAQAMPCKNAIAFQEAEMNFHSHTENVNTLHIPLILYHLGSRSVILPREL